jgi:type VI secretion system protein ImpG
VIEELLPYYEKQLQEFGQQSREFSQKYPKIAQRLSLNQEQVDDPHIERLIQFKMNQNFKLILLFF